MNCQCISITEDLSLSLSTDKVPHFSRLGDVEVNAGQNATFQCVATGKTTETEPFLLEVMYMSAYVRTCLRAWPPERPYKKRCSCWRREYRLIALVLCYSSGFVDEAELGSFVHRGNSFLAVHMLRFYCVYNDVRGNKTMFVVCNDFFVVVISQTDVAVSPLMIPA